MKQDRKKRFALMPRHKVGKIIILKEYDYQTSKNRIFSVDFTKEVICHWFGDNLSFLLFMHAFFLHSGGVE